MCIIKNMQYFILKFACYANLSFGLPSPKISWLFKSKWDRCLFQLFQWHKEQAMMA